MAFDLRGHDRALDELAACWRRERKVQQLWDRKATLWTGSDEASWMDWLTVLDGTPKDVDYDLYRRETAELVSGLGLEHALLLGMGGSSLFPELLSKSFSPEPGYLPLLVLDSTVPAEILAIEAQIDPARTLVIVSSKSGRTLETDLLAKHFYGRVCQAVGETEAGKRFLAITDKHDSRSDLEQMAAACGFRWTIPGVPGIGGRYSALSPFGMVPAAIMGKNPDAFIERAREMASHCGPKVAPEENPGVLLGLIMAVMASSRRDKITFICSPPIAALASWLEQLIAESTGKRGRGIVPIANEPLAEPQCYGRDRFFVYLRFGPEPSPQQESAVAALRQAGFPLVLIDVPELMDLAQELFRWQIATAVLCAELTVNPFDQPDVHASKAVTWQLTDEYEANRQVPSPQSLGRDGSLIMYGDDWLGRAAESAGQLTFETVLAMHLERLRPGDYFAVNAYLARSPDNDAKLQRARTAVRDHLHNASALGYGPRLLHSTGQLHKGGPNTGLFLQITAKDDPDLPAPSHHATFGLIKQFQAQGDFEVLCQRGRRVLWLHADGPLDEALERIAAATESVSKRRGAAAGVQ
jgi:glucose-6-phosphate isomerase